MMSRDLAYLPSHGQQCRALAALSFTPSRGCSQGPWEGGTSVDASHRQRRNCLGKEQRVEMREDSELFTHSVWLEFHSDKRKGLLAGTTNIESIWKSRKKIRNVQEITRKSEKDRAAHATVERKPCCQSPEWKRNPEAEEPGTCSARNG